ncbi:glycosyltransferase family 4 protein [uncultured Cohaesibacter sp.]|uniref:glycosyltransferase family 4 protein n=1 Tax=uncultured Cohaesibacter sp. TaxID=1002546 RepID=UPI00293034F5|nr:glycosyltransferase family 4 protein [uncultured Cohaesibacter sp.]
MTEFAKVATSRDDVAETPLTGLKPRPRILFIQTQAENAGAQEISRLLGEGLEPRGYDVHHLFFYRKTDAFDAAPKTIFCRDKRPGNPFSLLIFFIRLVFQIRALKPDVVLTFQHYGNLFGAPAARLAGVRHVIANQVSAQATMNDTIRKFDKFFGKIGLFDVITVNSVDTAGEYADFPPAYTRRIIHVPHGFKDKRSKLTKLAARKKFKLPEGVILLGSVARLNPLKRLDVAIKMLPYNDCWHLVLGGQGPDEMRLRGIAKGLGVEDRVHFTGEMESNEIGDLLAAMDIFVFPTEAETFGLAAVEAAQAGLPVVSNDIPVLREVLQTSEGPCSLFANSDNPESFVTQVRSLLTDQDLARQLVSSGQKLKAIYSMSAMIDRYDKLILDVAEATKESGELPV